MYLSDVEAMFHTDAWLHNIHEHIWCEERTDTIQKEEKEEKKAVGGGESTWGVNTVQTWCIKMLQSLLPVQKIHWHKT